MNICSYTEDLHGWICSNLVKRYYDNNKYHLKLYPYDNNKDSNILHNLLIRINTNDTLIILNVDLSDDQLSIINNTLDKKKAKLVHITNTNLRATCELVWQYYFIDYPLPKSINLLGELYSQRINNRTKMLKDIIIAFEYALSITIKSHLSVPRKLFDNSYDIKKQVNIGKLIIEYSKNNKNYG